VSKIEEVKNLVARLNDLVQSGQYDIELCCIDSKGNKSDAVSQLTCKSENEANHLAIMVILDKLESTVIKNYGKCEFNTIYNISNKLVTIYGIRATVNLPGGESVSRDWTYTDPRNLLPDDEFDIAVTRCNVSHQVFTEA